MRTFLLMILAALLPGCVTSGGHKTTSGWLVLDKAAEARCAPWPKHEKDLQTDEVLFVPGLKKGFLSSGLKRDASPQNYFAPFNGEPQVEEDDLVPMALGRSSVLLGGMTIGGRPAAVVVHNVSEGKSTIEVRTVSDNVVKFKADLAAFNAIEGSVTPSAGGYWVLFKSEENEYRIAFIDMRKPSAPALRSVANVSFKDKPQVVASAAKPGAIVVWLDGSTGKPFKAQQLTEEGVAGIATVWDVAVAAQVESWSVTQHAGSYYVAFVDGDSLVGQADLRISQLNWGDGAVAVRWTKNVPIRDIHVTEPVFLASSKGLEVLLLNWVDEESTIARYILAGGNIGKPAYSGVFRKGTRIVDAFTGKSADETYVITRHRDDTRWGFQICEI